MGSFDPSSIMRSSFFQRKQSVVDWESPSTLPFVLETYDTTSLFQDGHDPSDIVKILNFNTITQQSAPLFYNIAGLSESAFNTCAPKDTPLIVDTGASVCITPHRSDFITYTGSKMKIKDLSSCNQVAGEGTLKWNVVDTNGNIVSLRLRGYHIPQAEVRLLSPQFLLDLLGGTTFGDANNLMITLGTGEVLNAPYCRRSHLPHLSLAADNDDNVHSFWTQSFAFTRSQVCSYPAVLSSGNQNLTSAQKEVLLWHHRLLHASIGWLQLLMRDRHWLRDRNTVLDPFHSGPFLPCCEKTPSCDIRGLKCLSCICAKAHRRPVTTVQRRDSDNIARFKAQLDGRRKRVLKTGHTVPGDCVSADHYMSPEVGRLYSTYGRERTGYTCGTLFVDHASGKVFNFPQLSTSANDTIASKRALERFASEEGLAIKAYHSDNGTFASAAFKNECIKYSQKFSFSGVGAHHQNGVAERNIKTISQWARANMLHAAYHWPEHANVKLWPQAVDYAVWVFNQLPSRDTGYEKIYVKQPRGFRTNDTHVLCLCRSLYGLKQAPRHFFQYLSARLIKNNLTQSQFDPCLFMSSTMIVIVYVDDILIYAKDNKEIDNLIASMQHDEICLRREGTAEGYLGVEIKMVDGKIHLTQPGLSRRIIAALGLSSYSNSCQSPADVTPLTKDIDGASASGLINYASVVGMLLYLCGHSRPDLTFAVHQCARYTFAPTKRHEQALLRIGHYLKGTLDQGLIMTPSDKLDLDCYPDADFAGTWSHGTSDDPHSVCSRTGYIITLAQCPVIWASKMQSEIALSTMEAEYIALSTACRDLFPLIDKLTEITSMLNLPFQPGSNMHIRIHEDNAGALILGKLEHVE